MINDDYAPLSEYDPEYCNGRRVVARCRNCSGSGTILATEDLELEEHDRQWYEKTCKSCGGAGYFTEPHPVDTSNWVRQECGCDSGAVFCHSSISSSPVHAWYEACPRCGGLGFLLLPPDEASKADEEDCPF